MIAQTAQKSIRADYLVIGAGVIGLAIARELKLRRPGATVLVLEKEQAPSMHSSGRNSGVIHAGFYYAPDSLKARFTAEGNRRLRAYCEDKQIPLNRCAKVVVARSETDLAGLEELARRGERVGAGTRLIDEKELAQVDSNALTIARALYSPNTVTVDPVLVCKSLSADLKALGGEILCGHPYEKRISSGAIIAGGKAIEFGHLVNAAGLYADRVGKQFGFSKRYQILPFKGIYLLNKGGPRSARTNIYPVPNLKNPFLGVHFTITATGQEKIGPTAIPAFWRENYSGLSRFRFDELIEILGLESRLFLGNHFGFRNLALQEMRKYARANLLNDAASLVKELRSGADWQWGRPGIRAQLLDVEKMALEQDFVVEGDAQSTHVLNAVSPAFTSSLPFAEHVAGIVLKAR